MNTEDFTLGNEKEALQAGKVEEVNNDRRRFLKVMSAAVLGGAATLFSGCGGGANAEGNNGGRVVATSGENAAETGTEKEGKRTLAQTIEWIKKNNIEVVDGKRIWQKEWDLDQILKDPYIDEDALILYLYSKDYSLSMRFTDEECIKRDKFLRPLWPKPVRNQIEGQGHNWFEYFGTTEPLPVEMEDGTLEDRYVFIGIGRSYVEEGHTPQAIGVAQIAGTAKVLKSQESLDIQDKFIDEWLYMKLDNFEEKATQQILDALAKNQ